MDRLGPRGPPPGTVGDISLMWFPWATFLKSEALNARLQSETEAV